MSKREMGDATTPAEKIMQIAQGHFVSQALYSIVQLGIADILGDETKTINEIASECGGNQVNKDALLRIMRLLATAGIFEESSSSSNDASARDISFRLTPAGALLQTNATTAAPQQHPSMACCVHHWTERPLWDASAKLPDYVTGKTEAYPFDSANGMSANEFYGRQNPESLRHANDFVRFIASGETDAVLTGFDWNALSGKTVVDLGGYHGAMMGAVAAKFPDVTCLSLDLPDVIASAPPPPRGVELAAGDMFDPSTIPTVDAIFMKHVLLYDWDDEKCNEILQSCHKALPDNGMIILADAVLPDAGEADDARSMELFVDVLFMLVGRETGRTKSQWSKLADMGGFDLSKVVYTSSPSCSILVLSKK